MRARLATFVLAALAGCSSSFEPPAPVVTEAVLHYEVASAPAGTDLGPDAVAYVLGNGRDLGLTSDDDFAVVSAERGIDGVRHARLQQVNRGVPVWGGEIVAHADGSTFLGFNGILTKHLVDFDVTPVVVEGDAVAAAKADQAQGGGDFEYGGEASRLVIFPHEDGGASLAWDVEFVALPQAADGPPGRWRYKIDARSGAVLNRYDNLQTVDQASGPGGNAKVARRCTGSRRIWRGCRRRRRSTSRSRRRCCNRPTSGPG
jgi:Zn-dependent metalloprotease